MLTLGINNTLHMVKLTVLHQLSNICGLLVTLSLKNRECHIRESDTV